MRALVGGPMSFRSERIAGLVRLPPWPRRWLMLFRRYPSLLWDVEFLLKSLAGRSGITWSHVLRLEVERLLREAVGEGRACVWQSPKRTTTTPGDWRGEPV